MRKPPELVVTLAPLLALVLLAGVGVAFGIGRAGTGPATAPRTAVSSAPTGPAGVPTGGVDDVDPPDGLLDKVEALSRTQPAFSFQIASFNVLGASHTAPGGWRAKMADGPTRMGWTLQLLEAASVDVVGFQELQPSQYASFRSRTGDAWDSYPGTSLGRLDVDNSLAWDTTIFRAVEKKSVAIPYFGGRTRQMPYVLLEHRATEQRIWVANFHNPAELHGPQARHRQEATRREIALAIDLEATGYPVFVTGDMNARRDYCDPVTRSTRLHWAGGSCGGGGRMPVDWILGSERVRFAGYRIIDRGLVRQTSDHPLVHATATVPERRAPSLKGVS